MSKVLRRINHCRLECRQPPEHPKCFIQILVSCLQFWVCIVTCVSSSLRKVRESVSSDCGTRKHTSDGNHSKTSVSMKREDRVRNDDEVRINMNRQQKRITVNSIPFKCNTPTPRKHKKVNSPILQFAQFHLLLLLRISWVKSQWIK